MPQFYELPDYAQSLAVFTEHGPVHPTYQPPTDAFFQELACPRIVDLEDDRTYAAYTFNQKKLGDERPVSVTLPNRMPVASKYGALAMNAFATYMRRPLIAVDMPGDGKSYTPKLDEIPNMTIESEAQARLDILAQLEIGKEFDFMGLCLGGSIAAHAAMRAGNRAKHLLTYATLGFEDFMDGEYKERRAVPTTMTKQNKLDPTSVTYYRQALREDKLRPAHFRKLGEQVDEGVGSIPFEVFKMLGIRSCLTRLDRVLPEGLDLSTRWQDVISSASMLTTWENHAATVDARNQLVPNSSSVKVLVGAGHALSEGRILLTARDAELALQQM